MFWSDRRRTNNNLLVATADLAAECKRPATSDKPTNLQMKRDRMLVPFHKHVTPTSSNHTQYQG